MQLFLVAIRLRATSNHPEETRGCLSRISLRNAQLPRYLIEKDLFGWSSQRQAKGEICMRVALVAQPFLSVPPVRYGGTELFIAQLAEGLKNSGVEVVVYTNGASTVGVERRWLYKDRQWPVTGDASEQLRSLNHSSWAVHDAQFCDVIHLHDVTSLLFTRYIESKVVCTLHHKHEPELSEIYNSFPDVEYVCISNDQRQREHMLRMHTIHHGIDLNLYRLQSRKQDYLCFLGRLAPIKGTHIAIEVAKK